MQISPQLLYKEGQLPLSCADHELWYALDKK